MNENAYAFSLIQRGGVRIHATRKWDPLGPMGALAPKLKGGMRECTILLCLKFKF
jgi:hypothetical protein